MTFTPNILVSASWLYVVCVVFFIFVDFRKEHPQIMLGCRLDFFERYVMQPRRGGWNLELIINGIFVVSVKVPHMKQTS